MSKTPEGKFRKVHGCTNSSDAIIALKASTNAIANMESALASGEARKLALSKMDEATRKLFSQDISTDNIVDDARIRTQEFVRSIQLGVMKNISKFETSDFEGMDATELKLAHDYASNLYKSFPQFFPIPSSEKRS